eukprot:TRINITY_DN6862_c0_g1_i2.p1 TRINITY_DN6862_c0_g1~~TRINITY_DN6862_c0_g1_i2.p1  ORF type:complete len:138 (-),score=31.28 TRINITY_DN6862_c0_g1_i2:257-670(-)
MCIRDRTDSNVWLTWDSPTDGKPAGYEVEISNQGNMLVQLAAVPDKDAAKRTCNISELTSLKEYTFRVRAFVADDESRPEGKRGEAYPWSSALKVVTAYKFEKDAFGGMSAHHRSQPKKINAVADEKKAVCSGCSVM